MPGSIWKEVGGSMKYRIVKYANGYFGIQRRCLFFWSGYLDFVFKSHEDAKNWLQKQGRDLHYAGSFKVEEVFKEQT